MRTVSLILLICLFATVQSKCGVTYVRESRSWSSGNYRGYAYRALEETRFCQDLDQLKRCEAAQKIIDEVAYSSELRLTLKQKLNRPRLNCDSVSCYYGGEEQGSFWCENQELYRECLRAQTLLSDFAIAHGYADALPVISCISEVGSNRSLVRDSANDLTVQAGTFPKISIEPGGTGLTIVEKDVYPVPSSTSTTPWPTLPPRTTTSTTPEPVVIPETTESPNLSVGIIYLIMIGGASTILIVVFIVQVCSNENVRVRFTKISSETQNINNLDLGASYQSVDIVTISDPLSYSSSST